MKKMSLKEKRKMAVHLIERMNETRLDALLTLLQSPLDDMIVSEDDLAEVEYRSKQVREGKVKEIDARESLKKLRAALNKKKK